MKIHEILEPNAEPTTAPQPTATPTTPTKKYQSLDTLKKDPDALVNVWAPRMAQLQARCNSMLAKLVQAAGAPWAKKLAGTVVNVRSTDQYVQANAQARTIVIDLTVFWDAPDATLAVAIGHELGHIALAHVGTPTPQQSRKDEYDADDFGIRLAKLLGYDTAEVFKFMHDKEEYDFTNAISKMSNSTHPSYDQRIERAKKAGFKLSRGGQQQIDALQQHLA
jgi:Zn-dependent protease with chaperone function